MFIIENHSAYSVAPKNPADAVAIRRVDSVFILVLIIPTRTVCMRVHYFVQTYSNAHTNIIHIIVYSVVR